MIQAISSWAFCAHDYCEVELVHAAYLMFQHALSMPELEQWRIPAGKISVIEAITLGVGKTVL